MAAPVIESSTAITEADETTSFTVTKPTGLEVGNLLFALIAKDDDVDMNPPAGWSDGFQILAYDNSIFSFYKVADATDVAASNFTFTGDSEQYVGKLYRISGIDTSTPIDAVDTTGANNVSTSPQAPDLETLTDDALVFAMAGMDDDDTPFSIDTAGWTEDHNAVSNTGNGTCGIVIGRKIMSTAGQTGAVDFTINASESWAASQIAIKPKPPAQTHYGAVEFTGVGVLTTIARNYNYAAVEFSGSGNLAGIAKNFNYAITAFIGEGILSGVAQNLCYAITEFSGSGALACIAQNFCITAGNLEGSGALSGIAIVTHTGVAICSGSGNLSIIAKVTHTGKVTFSGSGELVVSSNVIFIGVTEFAGSGELIATGDVFKIGSVEFINVGTLAIIATVEHTGVAAMAGSGILSCTAYNFNYAAVEFSGNGVLSGIGQIFNFASALFEGSGELVTTATLIKGGGEETHYGIATLDGNGYLKIIAESKHEPKYKKTKRPKHPKYDTDGISGSGRFFFNR